jgi:hypothetical protein
MTEQSSNPDAGGFAPFQRRPIAVLNRVGDLLTRVGKTPTFSADALRMRAERTTGLRWQADAQTDEALDVLTTSIERQAQLSLFGRLVIRARLQGLLTTRLRVAALLAEHPEIKDLPIEPPIVIAGLQRSGTTMLHRLLAADPDMRSVQSWEVVHLLPSTREKPGRPSARMRQTKIAEWGLRYLAPQFFAIHSVEADAPEEDVLLLEYSLLSQVPEAMVHVPDYAEWLAKQDMNGAYAYLKTLLQVLQYQNPRKRWVLKTPAHLEHLDALLAVFPNALIVQTHRDPVRTTASFASMLAHGHAVFSEHVDAPTIARHWLHKNADMVDRALTVRSTSPQSFLDVSYYDLIDDPMTQVERIYSAAGLELTDTIRARMHAHQQSHTQNKHGSHRYTLEEFGLSADEVDAAYANYREYFGIRSEGNS